MELRPTSTRPSQLIEGRLATLVRERQSLRESNAPEFVLEQNRLGIVQAQLDLSRAFVSEHSASRVA